MAKKKKDYPYYTLKMPKKLSRLFERYIEKYESLGFKTVSQYANHILQEEGLRIVKNNPELADSDSKEENK